MALKIWICRVTDHTKKEILGMGKYQASLHPEVRKKQMDFIIIFCWKGCRTDQKILRNFANQNSLSGTILGASPPSTKNFFVTNKVECESVRIDSRQNSISLRVLGKGNSAIKNYSMVNLTCFSFVIFRAFDKHNYRFIYNSRLGSNLDWGTSQMAIASVKLNTDSAFGLSKRLGGKDVASNQTGMAEIIQFNPSIDKLFGHFQNRWNNQCKVWRVETHLLTRVFETVKN